MVWIKGESIILIKLLFEVYCFWILSVVVVYYERIRINSIISNILLYKLNVYVI